MMFARWLWAGGCCVTMASVFVWAGCSSDDGSPTPSSDAGPEDDAATKPDATQGEEAGAKEDAGPPPTVDISYGQCPAFTPCGGDVTGRWTVSGGCLSDDTFADFKEQYCPDLEEKDVVIKASGFVEAIATNLHQAMDIDLTANLVLPQTCLDALGVGSCALVEVGLTTPLQAGMPTFDTAKCTAAAGGCDCAVAKKLSDETEGEYTISGNTLETDSGRKFDYCVSGSKTIFQETTDGWFPIIVDLTK